MTVTRTRRTRKASTTKKSPARPKVTKVTPPARPDTLLKFDDYKKDIKLRLEIHNYESSALWDDVKWSYDKISKYVKSSYDRAFNQ